MRGRDTPHFMLSLATAAQTHFNDVHTLVGYLLSQANSFRGEFLPLRTWWIMSLAVEAISR